MHRKLNIIIKSTFQECVERTAQFWLDEYTKTVSHSSLFSVALSGGRTPEKLFKQMTHSSYSHMWDTTHIFQVDERFVPKDHKDNNYKMIEKTLISHINIPESNLHPIHILDTLEESAHEYNRYYARFFERKLGMDLVIMGIGPDGHIASLFPENAVLSEKLKMVAPVTLNEKLHNRITLTFSSLLKAHSLLFLISGEEKANILKEIIIDKNENYPAYHLMNNALNTTLILDRDAASGLRGLAL